MSAIVKTTISGLRRMGPLPLIAVGLVSNTYLVNLVEQNHGLLYTLTVIGAYGLFFGLFWAILLLQLHFLKGLTRPLHLVLGGRLRLADALTTYPECAFILSGVITLTTGLALTPSLLSVEENAVLVGMLVALGVTEIAAGSFVRARANSTRLPREESNISGQKVQPPTKERGALSALVSDL